MEASLAPAAYSGTSHGVEVTAWAGCRISSHARACCRAALRCVGVGALSSVLVNLPGRGKAPTFYIREYVHSKESRWP